MWLRPPLWANDVAFAFGFLPTKTRRTECEPPQCQQVGRNEATTSATRVLKTERSEVSRTALGSGGEALLRTRVRERTDVGWAWRGRCSIFETSHRLRFTPGSPWRPDAPGFCTSTGSASRRCACLRGASARPPGAAGSGDRSLPPPALPPVPFSVPWSLSAASLAAPGGKVWKNRGRAGLHLGSVGHPESRCK